MRKYLSIFLAIVLVFATVGFTYAATDVKNDPNLSTSLSSYYELEETSGDRVDSHGANDLTDTNTVTSGTGKQGTAAQFTAANSELLIDSTTSGLPSGSSDFSMAAWVNFDSLSANRTIIAIGTESATQLAALTWKTGNQLGYQGYSNDVQVSWTPSTGTWYHVAVTVTGQTVKFYVDGSQQGTTQTLPSAPNIGTSFIKLGSILSTNYMDGRIDEAAVWSKVLTATEVSDLYNSGNGIPYELVATDGGTKVFSGNITLSGNISLH